jgi:hypothetical protein
MLPIQCEEKWVSLHRALRFRSNELANGTNEADLLNDVCRALKNGLFDNSGAPTNSPPFLLYEKVSGRLLSPIGPQSQLYPYLRTLWDYIYVSKQTLDDLAVCCNWSPPSCCCDATKGASQPSQSPQLKPAPKAVVRDEIRFVYKVAKTADRKPPHINELPEEVLPLLEQKGFQASKRLIKEIGGEDEFTHCRRSPGKTLTSERREK